MSTLIEAARGLKLGICKRIQKESKLSPFLDNALCRKLPLIFADRNSTIMVTAMCWGFDVEDGWYSLIDVLCEELQRESDQEGGPQLGKRGQVSLRARSVTRDEKGVGLLFNVGGDSGRPMRRAAEALGVGFDCPAEIVATIAEKRVRLT